VGTDVVFAGGRFDPASAGGRALLAHEVGHITQQSRTGRCVDPLVTAAIGRLPRSTSGMERHADLIASSFGELVPPPTPAAPGAHPLVALAAENWTAVSPYKVTYAGDEREIDKEGWSSPSELRVSLGAFLVPASKGPWVERYNDAAVCLGTVGLWRARCWISPGHAERLVWTPFVHNLQATHREETDLDTLFGTMLKLARKD
jgi:hypothetical protein